MNGQDVNHEAIVFSIMQFFALESHDQTNYLPPIDENVKFTLDETGDTTIYPAQYFCFSSMTYLRSIRFSAKTEDKAVIKEIVLLLQLMNELTTQRDNSPTQYSYIWYFGFPLSQVSGTANVFWKVLNRLARQFLVDAARTQKDELIPFDQLRLLFKI